MSELRQLLERRQRLEAIKTYQARSGADLTTATQVIEVIEGR